MPFLHFGNIELQCAFQLDHLLCLRTTVFCEYLITDFCAHYYSHCKKLVSSLREVEIMIGEELPVLDKILNKEASSFNSIVICLTYIRLETSTFNRRISRKKIYLVRLNNSHFFLYLSKKFRLLVQMHGTTKRHFRLINIVAQSCSEIRIIIRLI